MVETVNRRKDITNEQIFDLYFNQGFNRRQTAEKLNCSQDLIAFRIKQMGLKPKCMADCVEAGKKISINISNELNDRLVGELLGDGGIHRYYNQGSFRESFGFDKIEWAEYLFNLFKKNNINITGDTIYKKNPSGKSPNISWNFSTQNIIELGHLHKKWYVKNKYYDKNKSQGYSNRKFIKTVPSDLKLSQLGLCHWYIGDGGILKKGGCELYTNGFTFDEVEFLRFRLKEDFNILSSHYDKNIIYIPRKESVKFLDIIGKCPVECYKYKWNMPENSITNKNISFKSYIDMDTVERFIKYREKL